MTILLAILAFCCFIAIMGCWSMLADIRGDLRLLTREYERSLAKDVRSRVQ